MNTLCFVQCFDISHAQFELITTLLSTSERILSNGVTNVSLGPFFLVIKRENGGRGLLQLAEQNDSCDGNPMSQLGEAGNPQILITEALTTPKL